MTGTTRICVLVSSEDAFRQARARRRYLPLAAELSKHGVELEIRPVDSIGHARELAHDVYIVNESYEIFPLVVAQHLRRSGKRIGVDLVEDHFSAEDAISRPLRVWLSSMGLAADFLLCATESLRGVADRYAPGLPVHVLACGHPHFDAAKLALTLGDKIRRFAQSGLLTVGWLARIDHPLVPVALAELASFGEELARLPSPSLKKVQLEVLTQGPTSSDDMASISRLGLPFEIHEWSEERQEALLQRSLVSFVPVAASAFAQRVDQVVTALLSGCQVLATGYPLPAALSPFIYRDSERLRDDLVAGSPALGEQNVLHLAQLHQVRRLDGAPGKQAAASPENAASQLIGFLRAGDKIAKAAPVATKSPIAAILHGANSPPSAHKVAQKVDALSVATPFALTKKWNFHIRFVPRSGGAGMDVLISKSQSQLLAPPLRQRLVSAGKILDTSYDRIGLEDVLPDVRLDGTAMATIDDPAALAAAYGPVTALVARAMKALLPGIRCFHSDNSSLSRRSA